MFRMAWRLKYKKVDALVVEIFIVCGSGGSYGRGADLKSGSRLYHSSYIKRRPGAAGRICVNTLAVYLATWRLYHNWVLIMSVLATKRLELALT